MNSPQELKKNYTRFLIFQLNKASSHTAIVLYKIKIKKIKLRENEIDMLLVHTNNIVTQKDTFFSVDNL